MHFLEHIIEPTKLLMAWQSLDEQHRTRYIVAELNRVNEKIALNYLVNTEDFRKAKENGFEPYPAFQNLDNTYQDVLDALMRRLPPRTRGDFSQYLEALRIRPDAQLSDFALLGYSGAKLPSDGYSIIHPFDNVVGACELLLEVAGFRHIQKNTNISIHDIKLNEPVSFLLEECNPVTQEKAVKILVKNNHVGYVNRALLPTFLNWMNDGRISGAWIEKINGTREKPALYLYVKISSKV